MVVELDLASGRSERVLEYETPPRFRPDDDPSIVFKTGSLHDGTLHLCTQTEVLCVDVPEFRIRRVVSLPSFNDVHHVRPRSSGTLLVANTGLDMVQEITDEGEVVREWTVADEPLWTRFSRDVDYRKVPSTKPHRSHPNFVMDTPYGLWVTRCKNRDLACLTDPDRPRIDFGLDQSVHDGTLRRGLHHFTSVEGWIHAVDVDAGRVVHRWDLREMSDRDVPLGWCRGLVFLSDSTVAVGFSRLRPTRWEENVRRLKRWLGARGWGTLPTRVGVFDLADGRLLEEHDLEPAGLNAIFSLHAAPVSAPESARRSR